MVKKVRLFSLAKGSDPDKAWRYWIDKHAANIKNIPGIRKYIINRVTKVELGEPSFWGIVEVWFDSVESEEAYLQAMDKDNPPDDFHTMTSDPRFSAWVEEEVIV